MLNERAARLAELVKSAIELGAEERSAFLDEECRTDPAMRAEIESLVEQQEGASRFIEMPALHLAPRSLLCEGAFRSGQRIGDYEIVSIIGSGGMGEVYLAEDRQLHRKVALKIVRRGLDAAAIIRRFHREEQILASLTHPNIARLYGGGVTPEGIPYFAMEYIKGERLDSYCDKQKLIIPERLQLFRKICSAVSYAHQHLVIHRDLKPANIRVTADGEPKLLDFGIARFLDPQTSDIAEQTMTFLGLMTPEYASPEQVRGETMTTASDVYSLGVVLYELLTDQKPYQVDNRTPANIARAIIEQEPQRPSTTALSSDGNRQSEIANRKSLRGDLDNIILMAMRKEPARRYQSVAEFSEDIRRHLEGLPVIARKDTLAYRSAKFVKRNRIGVAAIASIFTILLAATAISLYERRATLRSNRELELTLHHASEADLEAARQRFRAGAWREGIALLGRSLSFWPENRDAANYLLSAIAFGRGDRDKLPIFGVYHETDAAFSPDGRYFATASADQTIHIWNAATGAEVGKALRHEASGNWSCFSPDSRQLLTMAMDGVVKLWDIQTGKLLATMRHGRSDLDSLSNVTGAIFSSDGKRIVTSSYDHTTRVWNAASGQEIAQLVAPQRVSRPALSPDETRIVTPYWYGGAMLWDATTFQPIGTPMVHAATVRRALFTPDGNKIVTSSLDKTARIWDGHTGKPLSPPLKHDDFVWTLDISPDGKLVATASYDKTVKLWSTADGSPVGVPMQHAGPVNTVAFSPDGKRLVSASRDKTVRLWDVATCQEIGNPMRHDETVLGAIFNPADGTKVLSIGWDSAAYLWDAEPPPWPGEVIPIPGQVCSIEFLENDDRAFVATRDGQAGIWSLSRKQFITPVAHQNDAISLACYHCGSSQIATVGQDGIIRFWSGGKQTGATKPTNDAIVALAFAPDAQDGIIRFWSGGKQTGATKPTNDAIVALAFASDGHSLFAAYLSGSVIQWRVPEGTQIGNVMRHSEKMDALAVAPSGKEIAAGCRDDYLYLWKPGENSPPRKVLHNNPVRAVAYSPDGRFVATGCDDNTARIWSLDSEKQLGEPFYLNGRPTTLHYIANGNALLVGGITDTDVDYYDIKTHDSLSIPLPHLTGVSHITSNADGSLVMTVTNDGVAHLWRIPSTSGAPPKWLAEYLRAIGGLTFSAQQQLTPVSTRERLELRKKLLTEPPDNSIWDHIMRRSFEHNQ